MDGWKTSFCILIPTTFSKGNNEGKPFSFLSWISVCALFLFLFISYIQLNFINVCIYQNGMLLTFDKIKDWNSSSLTVCDFLCLGRKKCKQANWSHFNPWICENIKISLDKTPIVFTFASTRSLKCWCFAIYTLTNSSWQSAWTMKNMEHSLIPTMTFIGFITTKEPTLQCIATVEIKYNDQRLTLSV